MQEKNMGHICPIGRSGVNEEMLEDGAKSFRIPILFP